MPARDTATARDPPADGRTRPRTGRRGQPGEVLVVRPTPARCRNAGAAARRARDCGITVLAMTGPAPNPLEAVAHDAVSIDSPWTATVQECHLVALHLLCAAFDAAVLADSPRISSTNHVEVIK